MEDEFSDQGGPGLGWQEFVGGGNKEERKTPFLYCFLSQTEMNLKSQPGDFVAADYILLTIGDALIPFAWAWREG